MRLKQLEPVEETIGDYKFYITPFPAMKAANITGELVSILVPLFGALVPLAGKSEDLGDVDVGQAAEAIAKSVSIDGNKLEKMIKNLLLGGHIGVEFDVEDEDGNVETEGQKLDMDILNEIFCCEIQDMFILCFYVLRLNFSGFFRKFAGQSGKAGSAVQKMVRKII